MSKHDDEMMSFRLKMSTFYLHVRTHNVEMNTQNHYV